MESNIIRWLNNSKDSILDSILIVSGNGFFISKLNLMEFASSKRSYLKKFRKGLTKDQSELLKSQILNVLPSYYINNTSANDNEIMYSYNNGKENNLRFESSIRQIIDNNLVLNRNHFVKVNISNNTNNNNNNNNSNNNNDNNYVNSINNNNYIPTGDQVSIDINKLQKIQKECSESSSNGPCIVKNNGINEISVIELVPDSAKNYFNKNIPLEISKLMDPQEYYMFISKLNQIYSGDIFILVYIIIYLLSIGCVGLVAFTSSRGDDVIIACIIFSVITVCFFIFYFIYCLYLKYIPLTRAVHHKNLKLIKQNSRLEFSLVYKQVKFPQTRDTMTLQILILNNDKAATNNDQKEIEKDNLRDDIINETINNNLNKLNQIDNV
ncbi:hypothetical protein DICPUDRAFT_85604 [Dictyostelium purpureum]|uniref:Uncharacterized protein n=1 Tax=Dictyostelium purpureum TaxID=5786 RepID=F1A692_DICPU|nr:uncharacterized protein DICPUDRAFT_85604 [Dictyostelium purpureum]EGC28288.1 hypothetical protein DICPUDRAFT_85604 [Dictyostelium purpureum]|eukprot:XP_003295186.1 hypothetical protein DICPUDRAFT_85604 [Dictyostelium purpureum]